MSHADPTTDQAAPGASRTTAAWVVVAVLLAIGIVVPLLVGLYDSVKPTLFGFPFFFWFQFLLIPIVSVLTFIAFRLAQSATARDREQQGLRPYADREGEL
jgi:membrane protein implicated in regulation of membrane protease activity